MSGPKQQTLQNSALSTPYHDTDDYKPSRMLNLVLKILPTIQEGELTLILPNGRARTFGGQKPGPKATLYLRNDRPIKRFLTHGKLGFCESYLDDEWSSPDITTLFKVLMMNGQAMKKTLLGKPWARALSYVLHRLKPNTRGGSRKNIYAHYDIGNDFYGQWLDPTMTYSSAYFADGIEDLETAQNRKYQEILNRLNVKPFHHILEIGCGWGGFAEYAAKTLGCRVTAITVSKAQYDYAKARIEKANLSEKVNIKLQDYRDVQGSFDRIASIEMFEAVGEKYWPTFFQRIQELLKPGGRSVLQIITIKNEDFHDYRKGADYIQRYIFPGGMLPSSQILSAQINQAGLEEGACLKFGKDYARTLSLWNADFQKSWPKLKSQGFDERFKRLWEQYFSYCEAGFDMGSIDVVHQTVIKP